MLRWHHPSGTERSVAVVLGNFQTQCVELSTDSSWLSQALSNTFSDPLSVFGDLYLRNNKDTLLDSYSEFNLLRGGMIR